MYYVYTCIFQDNRHINLHTQTHRDRDSDRYRYRDSDTDTDTHGRHNIMHNLL